MSTNLLFIISQPRSGSTLLQSVASNNEQVATASEPWLLFHFLSYYNPELVKAKYSYQFAHTATEEFLNKTGFREEMKKEVSDFLHRVYQKTLGGNDKLKYILDKTPRYYEIAETIRMVFPDARIVILKRNPLAVLNSIIDTWAKDGINQLYNYYRDILYAPSILQNFCLRNESNRNVFITKYEDIVEEPLVEFKKLYQWLGIEFKEEYLDYSKNKKFKGRFGDPIGIHQRSKPEKKEGEWLKKMLDPYWKNFFSGYADYLGSDFFTNYGYATDEIAVKRTKIFDTFKNIVDNEVPEQPPIRKQFLRQIYYRNAYKSYSR